MRLDYSPGYGKPKACSGVFCAPFRFASPADLEDPGQVVVVDASTLVSDGEPRPAIGSPPRADLDPPLCGGVADGVADESGEGTGELVTIALHGKAIGVVGDVQDEFYLLAPGMFASLTYDVVGQLDQAQWASGLCLRSRRGIEP